MIRAVSCSILLALAAGATQSQSAESPVTLILANATVIDGTGAAPARRTLVIRGERIAEVRAGKAGTKGLIPPRGTRVIDLAGRHVVPGFVDAHVHVATDPQGRDANAVEQLRGALLGGVTTVRDMAGDAVVLRTLAARGDSAAVASPRIRFAALMAGPSFFQDPRSRSAAHGGTPGEVSWMRAVTPETDVKSAVAAAKATGATAIKLYADLSPADVKRVAREAHAQGLAVWSHATLYPARPSDATDAGVDVLSHAILLYWQRAGVVPERYHARGTSSAYDSLDVRAGAMDVLLREMARRGVVLDATLFISARLESAPSGAAGMASPARAVQWMYDVTRRARELGVTVDTGTDGMMPGSVNELPNIHREMELLVTRSGFTPMDAIVAATRNSARAAGVSDRAGTIETGKLADLVVLDGNPLEDIRNTRRVQFVVKGGQIHARSRELAALTARPSP